MEQNTMNTEQITEKNLDELEQLIELMHEKNERIEELEMALHESVSMIDEKEKHLDEEEEARRAIMEKVQLLELKLHSVLSLQSQRCSSCQPLLGRVQTLEHQCETLLEEKTQLESKLELDEANANGPFRDYADQEDNT
uniref:Uncharacterized protein n=1 Tax=Cacopsylla melanoneura TaxID=428564 RepID=A0A8D8X723_9HEMI